MANLLTEQMFTFKTAHSKPVILCVLPSLVTYCGPLTSPYELCGPPVGFSWPALAHSIVANITII